ncbi:MAG: glutamate 5-kinase [Gammaproteobacteria bacterium]
MTGSGQTSASRAISSAQTLVVKVGSSLLVDAQSNSFREAWFKTLISDLVELRKQGKRVIVVSSGAIALGCLSTGGSRSSQTLAQNQASAAVGQIRLAREFERALAVHGTAAAQVLLTLDDTEQRTRYLNARKALEAILDMSALPFINENDTVATSEIRFGDNDRLAARVAQMMSADCLLLLSDVAGLYEEDPRRYPGARLLERVDSITPEIQSMAGSPGSLMGSGGMTTKIDAAAIAVGSGCHMVLASGLSEHPVRAVSESGRCTHFVASGSPVTQRKQWIAGSLQLCGEVHVDDGAVAALKAGSSLLPIGVTRINGAFERGDAVSVVDGSGREIYRGLCAYGADDARRIVGLHSQDIVSELGFVGPDELIHRDDLVLAS